MKKILILLVAALLPLVAGAQAQINTKKVKISDFTEKITKVVISGDGLYDNLLHDEIIARWRVSPYEFCTLEEFEALKTSDQYYFLIPVQGQFKKETAPGIQFLTLVKGGKDAKDGISDMLEIVSLPFAATEMPSGREIIFIPALVDIIQAHALEAMDKDINAYGGLANHSGKISKAKNMNIVFSEDDLAESVSQELIDRVFDEKMSITDEEGADQYMLDNTPETLVSYVVTPVGATPGSYCYTMLIDAQTHQLYYFRRHKITANVASGFLPKDIDTITKPRAHLRKK